MEWFVLTTVFTDQAYKSCESGGMQKKKKKCRLQNYARGAVEEWRSGGARRIYCRGSHFLGGQSELHKRTLLAHLCSKAPEPANHCDSLDRVDNHRWRLLPRYLLLSFVFRAAFTVNNSKKSRFNHLLCHNLWRADSRVIITLFSILFQIWSFLSLSSPTSWSCASFCCVLWSDVSQELSLSTQPIWSTAPASGCN